MDSKRARFESAVSPHVDAAYNLARWLTGNDHDADDVAQEAMLRAFMYFDGFRGGDARSWVLKIVRNTCFTWLQANRPSEIAAMAAEELEEANAPLVYSQFADDPETLALRRTAALQLNNAIADHTGSVSGSRRITGDGRTFLQGNCDRRRCADRHSDVAPGASPGGTSAHSRSDHRVARERTNDTGDGARAIARVYRRRARCRLDH